MTDYEIYNLVLCLIVFVLLTVLFAITLSSITKMYKRLILCGQEDEKLRKEYDKMRLKDGKAGNVVAVIFNVLICCIFVAALIFSVYINYQEESVSYTVPTYRVVKSDSMSQKLSTNTYLYENDINDQFDTFDIILTYKMPDESDLELYDVVVYKYGDSLVIHRIIGIEEPNEEHPDSRLFIMRGDANTYSDGLKVDYSQMMGIYRGERVRFVGSLVLFLQSPAGWLCVLLILAAVIFTPMIESSIGKSKYRRLVELGVIYDADLLNEIKEEKRAKQLSTMPGGFYDKVGVRPAPNKNTLPLSKGAVTSTGGKKKKRKANGRRWGGHGFYDVVELNPDGSYRTVQTEAERSRSKKK